jgi:hypothetical protein
MAKRKGGPTIRGPKKPTPEAPAKVKPRKGRTKK